MLSQVLRLVLLTCRAKIAPEKAFRMRADISAEDKALKGVPISRAEAFGSSSASSEESEGEYSSDEGSITEFKSESNDKDEEDEASDARTDSG